MMATASRHALRTRGRHPRWGAISVREHATEWAYHDLDHLRQLLELFQSELHGGIGVFQGLYPRPGAPGTA